MTQDQRKARLRKQYPEKTLAIWVKRGHLPKNSPEKVPVPTPFPAEFLGSGRRGQIRASEKLSLVLGYAGLPETTDSRVLP
jgi:hypothetical protein